jgi:hypothetical protein
MPAAGFEPEADADLRSRTYGHRDRLIFVLGLPIRSAQHEVLIYCVKEELAS